MPRVTEQVAVEADNGQRLDNYLVRRLKGVPKSRIYRAIRGGEVRVNGSRVRPSYRLKTNDRVRVPPLRTAAPGAPPNPPPGWLERVTTLHQDRHLLVVDKPSGMAVHAGSGLGYGLIEALRHMRTDLAGDGGFLELAHRLDRETSGCLMLARSRDTLLELHRCMAAAAGVEKTYLALVSDAPLDKPRRIDAPLARTRAGGGDSRTVVDPAGQEAVSVVRPVSAAGGFMLVEIDLLTGRTHQARVHCAHAGLPIAGDRLYGDPGVNAELREHGLGRLFLHAYSLKLPHPATGKPACFRAPLPPELHCVLSALDLDFHDYANHG